MTPVKFEFLEPDGTPLANLVFEIKMTKSGFLEEVDGIVMPDTVEATTDELGVVTVLLAPSSSLYYLKVISPATGTEEDCCASGIFYKFYVPDIATEVRVQDLIMDPPPSTKAWDEAAMLLILDAKVHSAQSAAEALASEVAAGVSEDNAAQSATASALSAQSSEGSHQAAVGSASAALASQQAAHASELASKSSQDASRASELAAAASADFAAGAVQDMQDQVDEATRQAVLSATSAGNSATSAGQASTSAGQASASATATAADVVTTGQNKVATAADVVTSTNLKTQVTGLKDETKGYRDDALAAVGTLGAVIQNGGPVDLSAGAYPAKPAHSTLWKVTVGGTVGGVQGDVYGAGDTLMYAQQQDLFYKIDNTENVSSVAGKTGAVALAKGDVGLGNVDNTSDLNKPISTAVQTQLTARTVTTSNLDVTAGHLVKVGDFGENGGAAISQANTVDADLLAVPATFLFASGGLHLPEASVYLKHMISGTVGQAKQLAWGLLTDKTYVRTQIGGIWSAWAPSTEIIDNLTSTDTNKALSAKQGKVLYDMVQANNATIIRYNYTVALGQTAISGVDINGKTLSYVPGGTMLVTLNGVDLWIGNDFTASNGTLLTLITAAEAAGEMAITVFGAFSVANHYTKTEEDALLLTKMDKTAVVDLAHGGTAATTLTAAQQTLGIAPYNYINNGKMQIAQFGASFAGLTATAFTLDRWLMGLTGPTVTVAQEADTHNTEYQFNMSTAITTAATMTSAQYLLCGQNLEGFNARRLVGKTFTLTFDVFTSLAGIYCCSFRNGVGDRSYVVEYTVTTANTWQTVSVTVPGGLILAGTWNWTNGVGLSVGFSLGAGSTFNTASPNTWVSANVFSTANQVNLAATVGNKFYITGVRLTEGATQSQFPPISYADDLWNCQRYGYRCFPSMMGICIGTTQIARAGQPHPVKMRANPVVAFPGNIDMWDGALLTNGNLTTNYSTVDAVEVDCSQGGGSFTAGRPGKVFSASSARYMDVTCPI